MIALSAVYRISSGIVKAQFNLKSSIIVFCSRIGIAKRFANSKISVGIKIFSFDIIIFIVKNITLDCHTIYIVDRFTVHTDECHFSDIPKPVIFNKLPMISVNTCGGLPCGIEIHFGNRATDIIIGIIYSMRARWRQHRLSVGTESTHTCHPVIRILIFADGISIIADCQFAFGIVSTDFDTIT